ncbi:Ribosomal large subunit pseudouridine synthase B [Calidithermus terrae]|uniref:Pseudouridine synthase n=1 Tax=Calidithermus terrae TaxID=1408545 RepID=A0A399EI75_9DEIN|nr:pseudouridine synthase [Calidithermus terrae]RIH82032.1 Ribosomal large subunit pseudouridine synthase B [Calidithermus terrae]
MRLQQFLARAGIASRRKAEELIRAGRVTVNGQVAGLGSSVGEGDVVHFDGERVRLPQRKVVIALHKPAGVTTTKQDRHAERTVYQLVPDVPGLHPVGRLDRESEGLLLLTNDGDLTERLTHPRYGVRKVYRAWCRGGEVSLAACRRLVSGVELEDGPAKALEAKPMNGGARLVMTEGRKREVRRMLKAVGYPVERLVRTQIGMLELGGLKPGEWRYLGPEEIAALTAEPPKPKPQRPKPQPSEPAREARRPRPHPAREKPRSTPEAPAKPRKQAAQAKPRAAASENPADRNRTQKPREARVKSQREHLPSRKGKRSNH